MPSIIIEKALELCKDFITFSPSEKTEIAAICEFREYKAGQNVFSIEHQERFVFIVVMGRLTLRLHNGNIKEFKEGDIFGEITLFSTEGRMGAIHCNTNCTLVLIDKHHIAGEGMGLSLALRLKLLHILGKRVASYLYSDGNLPVKEMLKRPEGLTLEFKASLSDKARIEESIVAFMNAEGGTLLIGVNDNGKLSGGINHLSNKAIDEAMLGIRNSLKNKAPTITATLFFSDVQNENGQKVLRITIKPSPYPVVMLRRHDDDTSWRFMVRTGRQNTEMKSLPEILTYCYQHFPDWAGVGRLIEHNDASNA